MTLDANRHYLGDNGRLFCGSLRCAGMTAYYSGHDLSGQPVMLLEPEHIRQLSLEAGPSPYPIACEGCGKVASALVTR